MQQIQLPITGMTCGGCASRLTRELGAVPGVADAQANFATETAAVSFDAELVSPADLVQAITASGFGCRLQHHTLTITGMHCSSCATRIRDALLASPGVIDAEVNVALDQANVTTLPEVSDLTLTQVIEAAGYRVVTAQQQEVPNARGLSDAQWLVISALCTAPLALQMIGMWLGGRAALTPLGRVGTGHSGAMDRGLALLSRRLDQSDPSCSQHGHPGCARHHRGLWI